MVFPEQTVKSVVDYCLKYLKDDYTEQVDKEKSYLFSVFGEYKESSVFDYWKNAVALLTRSQDEPRAIETHFFLNRNRFTLPTIHVTLNSDQPGPDGVGFDRGWGMGDGDGQSITSGREFNTRFQIVITSDNTFEVLIMYHVLMACLIGNNHLLSLNGIQNPSLKGGDIILNDQSNPTAIYARAIFLDCNYSLISRQFGVNEDLVSDINFFPTIQDHE